MSPTTTRAGSERAMFSFGTKIAGTAQKPRKRLAFLALEDVVEHQQGERNYLLVVAFTAALPSPCVCLAARLAECCRSLSDFQLCGNQVSTEQTSNAVWLSSGLHPSPDSA